MWQASTPVRCAPFVLLAVDSMVLPQARVNGIPLLEDGLEACQSGRGKVEILTMKVREEGPAENATRLGILYLRI